MAPSGDTPAHAFSLNSKIAQDPDTDMTFYFLAANQKTTFTAEKLQWLAISTENETNASH